MKILELKDNELHFEPNVLTIPEFKRLWDIDKDKFKKNAFKELLFVYHMADNNSPYSNYPEENREHSVIEDIILDKNWKPSEDVNKAIIKYRELSETPKQRLLEAAKFKIDEIAKFLRDTKLTEDSSKAILEIFKNISTTIKNFDDIEKAVKKESEQGETRIRGDKSKALFEE